MVQSTHESPWVDPEKVYWGCSNPHYGSNIYFNGDFVYKVGNGEYAPKVHENKVRF
jgi:hypothetical protein